MSNTQAERVEALMPAVGCTPSHYESCDPDEVRSVISHLVAENEALRADAERYRWLRDGTEWEPFQDSWLTAHGLYGQGPLEMDDFIDQAIAARNTTQQQGG